MKFNSVLPLYFCSLIILSVLLHSCEKEVNLIIPPAENKYVIEGTLELGGAPIVLISQTKDYNESISIESFDGFYLGGATVVVTHNNLRDTLDQICTADLPAAALEQIAELTGISIELLANSNICGYTDISGTLIGEESETYELEVSIEDSFLTSSTTIPELVTLDSLWFGLSGQSDSLGFAYASLTDPAEPGNAYRWFAKRINVYPEWSDRAGEEKDGQYIAPLGSAYDDSFFNGLSFDFAYYRGSLPGSSKEDDLNDERGFFKQGDTIAIRGTSIDLETYEYVVSFEAEASSAGNPFTAPAPVYSNINGGIGIWAGYAPVYDTLIAIP